jgi:hypothetical protein
VRERQLVVRRERERGARRQEEQRQQHGVALVLRLLPSAGASSALGGRFLTAEQALARAPPSRGGAEGAAGGGRGSKLEVEPPSLIEVGAGELEVGRSRACGVQLGCPDQPGMLSKRHATVRAALEPEEGSGERAGEGPWLLLRDLGSAHGTFVHALPREGGGEGEGGGGGGQAHAHAHARAQRPGKRRQQPAAAPVRVSSKRGEAVRVRVGQVVEFGRGPAKAAEGGAAQGGGLLYQVIRPADVYSHCSAEDDWHQHHH